MKASELRQKSNDELKQTLLDLRREQFTLRMQQGMGQLSRHTQIKTVRRGIARIKTILTEKGEKV